MLSELKKEAFMQGLRGILAAALSATLATAPLMGAPTASVLGTVVTADRAHVDDGLASVGTTVFAGDKLTTEDQGSVQIRAGAARLLLLGASSAMVNDSEGAPSAKLLLGTATFSTGNAHAFTLYASKAAIRAQSDAPTIGQVRLLNAKELLVTSKRGPLSVTVDGETQTIEEGKAYHVYLDPDMAAAQGPSGAGGGQGPGGKGGSPLKAGRSRFLIVVVAVTAIATYFAVSESLESPSRP
jgi:hypothetical protein